MLEWPRVDLKIGLFRWGRALLAATLSISLALGTVSVAPHTFAQNSDELAKARSLYKEGLSLEAAGDWASALSKFEAVGKVKTTPQVRYHIGRCKEHLGRLNEALGEYRLAEYEAQQAKAKELDEITKARTDLEARVPKLTIKRGEGAEGTKVEMDGVALGEAQIGKEITTDPGPHRIVAKFRGQEFETSVQLAEGEKKTVDLVPPEGFGKGGGAATKEEPEEKTEEPPPADVKIEKKKKSVLPWIIGGAGLVSLGASGFFFLQRNKAKSDLDKICKPDGTCPTSAQSKQDDGERYAMLTNVTLGIGVIGVGVAAVLLIAGSSSKEDKTAKGSKAGPVSVNVVTAPRAAGVSFAGRF